MDSLQPLARRWRPALFKTLIGQNHVSLSLQNSIKSGHIGESFIFAGPRGSGKTSCARIFARALCCEGGPNPEPCNSCPSCKDQLTGINLDIREMDAASQTGVENIRELRQDVLSPPRGRFLVYIIDEVHMLSTSAFSALLKLIEEPPEYLKFVFATTELHKVPNTIQSRSQVFQFMRIETSVMVSHLQEIAKKEGITLEGTAAASISEKSDGSLRDALNTFDQLRNHNEDDQITQENFQDALRLIKDADIEKIIRALTTSDVATIIRIIARCSKNGYPMHQLISQVLEWFRIILLSSEMSNDAADIGDDLAEIARIPCEAIQKARSFSQDFKPHHVHEILHRLSQTWKDLSYTDNDILLAECVFYDIARYESWVYLPDMKKRLEALEDLLERYKITTKNNTKKLETNTEETITKEAKKNTYKETQKSTEPHRTIHNKNEDRSISTQQEITQKSTPREQADTEIINQITDKRPKTIKEPIENIRDDIYSQLSLKAYIKNITYEEKVNTIFIEARDRASQERLNDQRNAKTIKEKIETHINPKNKTKITITLKEDDKSHADTLQLIYKTFDLDPNKFTPA